MYNPLKSHTALALLLLLPASASAYIGPGAGLGGFGAFAAIVLLILFTFLGFFWYPLKRLISKARDQDIESEDVVSEPIDAE